MSQIPPESTVLYIVSSHPLPCHPIFYHPIPSSPLLSSPIPCYLLPSHLILSSTIPSHLLPSHLLPSYPLPSHLLPSHHLSYHSIPFHPIPPHLISAAHCNGPPNQDGAVALTLASAEGHLPIVTLLIAAKADVNFVGGVRHHSVCDLQYVHYLT